MSSPITPISSVALRLGPGSPLSLALASILAFGGLSAVAGCHGGPPAAAEVDPAVAAAPEVPPANPLVGVAPVEGERLAGVVAEVLPAGGYTYFRLSEGGWAVVMGPGPAVGQAIEAAVFARKTDFRSRRLDRAFAELAFVNLSGG